MVVVLLGKDALLSHIPPIFLLRFNNCIDFYPASRTADLSFLSCDAWPSLVLLDFVGFILLGFFYFNVWKFLPSQYNLNFKLFPIKTPVVSILQCFNSRTNFFFQFSLIWCWSTGLEIFLKILGICYLSWLGIISCASVTVWPGCRVRAW